MTRLAGILLCLTVLLLGGCTTETQWNRKMHYVHPDDPRYEWGIPFADP